MEGKEGVWVMKMDTETGAGNRREKERIEQNHTKKE